MSTRKDTAEFLVEQLSGVEDVRARRMFGEYGIYVGDRFVAVVCDEDLFVKPTVAGRKYFSGFIERSPFPGAKPWLMVPGEYWDDREWLAGLFLVSAAELPAVKPKVRKKEMLPGRS
jgi:TfoX/Sxy family transcriptional regulator of competence genes